jgi:hypothetical protein
MKKIILVALTIACLSGCERYARVGESGDRLVVRDTLNGRLYMVFPGGFMREVPPPSN